jgi:hypothetical protein
LTAALVCAALLVVLETAALESLRVAGVLPDLLLILTVYSSLFFPPPRALVAGAVVGSLAALASPSAWSLYPALYGAAGWLASHGWRQFLRASPAIEAAFLLPLGLFVNAAILATEYGATARLGRAVAVSALPNALATAAIGPLAFGLIRKRLPSPTGGLRERVSRRW